MRRNFLPASSRSYALNDRPVSSPTVIYRSPLNREEAKEMLACAAKSSHSVFGAYRRKTRRMDRSKDATSLRQL